MKRTQEEIKRICDEIKHNVSETIRKEELKRSFRKAGNLISKHEEQTISGMKAFAMVHAAMVQDVLDNNPRLRQKLMEYKKRKELES